MAQLPAGRLLEAVTESYQDGGSGQDEHRSARGFLGQSLDLTSVMQEPSATASSLHCSGSPGHLPPQSSTSASEPCINPYIHHGTEMPAGPDSRHIHMDSPHFLAPAGFQNRNNDLGPEISMEALGNPLVDRSGREEYHSGSNPTSEACLGPIVPAMPVGMYLSKPENNSTTEVINATMTQRATGPISVKPWNSRTCIPEANLDRLPNEILMHIFSCLDVCDLLATSRINHHLRSISLLPVLHHHRLQRARFSLPFLLTSPSRPSLTELIARHIFLTHTTQVSRKLARSLVAIRLSRRLPLRPSADSLVQRGVLPGECVDGFVAPGLVAKKRAVEKERLKDGLRKWVGGVWKGEVWERGNRVQRWDESRGVGRVWKLRRFWERVANNGNKNDGTL